MLYYSCENHHSHCDPRETGFYYLQSRYYDPSIGRFINADSFASTGQGFAGYNMFSYCGNTPTSRKDTNGHFWLELLDEFTHAVQQTSGYFGMAAGISQLDTLAIGPADAVAAGVAFLAPLHCGGVVLNNVLNTDSFSNSSTTGQKNTEEGLSDIANSYGNYQCDKAKDSMVDYLTKNGKSGAIITINFVGGYGYVMSNKRDKVISETGFHVGVSYNGIVYCNVHPFGLPEAEWIADFEGTGTKCVLRTPF